MTEPKSSGAPSGSKMSSFRCKERQKEAQTRQAARNKRTDQQQIDRLTAAGFTATREIERLTKRIERKKDGKS